MKSWYLNSGTSIALLPQTTPTDSNIIPPTTRQLYMEKKSVLGSWTWIPSLQFMVVLLLVESKGALSMMVNLGYLTWLNGAMPMKLSNHMSRCVSECIYLRERIWASLPHCFWPLADKKEAQRGREYASSGMLLCIACCPCGRCSSTSPPWRSEITFILLPFPLSSWGQAYVTSPILHLLPIQHILYQSFS